MRKIKVLIADDNKSICENIKTIINRIEEVEIVEIAADGEEEYKFIKQFKPDFLFSDVQMPKMTGIEVLEKLNYEKFEYIPTTVFVTAENINIFSNSTIIGNVYDVIKKPFNNMKILNIIKSFIYDQISI